MYTSCTPLEQSVALSWCHILKATWSPSISNHDFILGMQFQIFIFFQLNFEHLKIVFFKHFKLFQILHFPFFGRASLNNTFGDVSSLVK